MKTTTILDLAQAELRSCYKRLNINSSNILDLIDQKYTELQGNSVRSAGYNSAAADFVSFNLNNEIKFKWTKEGERQFLEYYKKLCIKPVYPKSDENGFYRLQLWEFMHIFGEWMFNGAKQAIEDNIIMIAAASL